MKKAAVLIICSMILFCGCTTLNQNTSSASSIAGEPTWWAEALNSTRMENDNLIVSECRIYRNTGWDCADAVTAFGTTLMANDFSLLMSSAKEAREIGEPLDEPSFFEVVLSDNTRYIGTFYEKGFSLTEDGGRSVLLSVESGDYQTLLAALMRRFDAEKLQPAWLKLMQQKDCNSITITTSDGQIEKSYTTIDTLQFQKIYSQLQYFWIVPGSTETVSKTAALAGAVTIHIAFADGGYFDLQCDGKKLMIAADDRTDAVQYELYHADSQDIKGELDKLATEIINPPTD